jgi:rsbT co-antagonist protein RsbR
MLEAELEAITIHRARVMPVDITGVPIVDTSVALQLIRAADAAKLLGCQTILVGVRPEIAQILVGLGIDLRGIATARCWPMAWKQRYASAGDKLSR